VHARSGALQLSTDRIDDALEAFRTEHLPRYRQQSGYKGFTLMVNRRTGQMLGVSFWESESDLHGTDELGNEARQDLQARGGGEGAIERADWEVVVDDMA
jgi:heme-degrading monooxygenase HmoA